MTLPSDHTERLIYLWLRDSNLSLRKGNRSVVRRKFLSSYKKLPYTNHKRLQLACELAREIRK